LWNRRGTEEDIFGGSTATPVEGQYQFRNSVYRRKLTQRDVDAILARVNTYADAIREGNRLGITKSELDGLVQHRYASEDQEYDTRRKVFADLYKRLHIPSTHNVFGDDHADKYWQKRKFDWEAYATEVLPTFGFDNIRYRPENPSYEDNAEYTDWAVNWLWDLYKGGPPRRKGTQAQRYKEALEEILHDHMQSKKVNKLVNNSTLPSLATRSRNSTMSLVRVSMETPRESSVSLAIKFRAATTPWTKSTMLLRTKASNAPSGIEDFLCPSHMSLSVIIPPVSFYF
jgi:hypothetical protein